jgi:alkylated DNA repair protein (DNA oxidative demethylase)
MTQAMLFEEPLIAGLDYRADFVGADEERELLDHLGALDLAPFRFHGWTGNRKTQSFGWRYDFDDASFTRADPLPDWLLPLRAKAAAMAGAEPGDFVHVLLARYDPGAGIGWHRDRPVFEKVVGVSLNTVARLRFRRRKAGGFDRFSVDVAPRSAYLLSGEARHEWEHSIAPGEQLRFSITFRTLSGLGRRKAEAQRIS